MVDLTQLINTNTWIISDSHFGHANVLLFEKIRLEYLADYNTDVVAEVHELLTLINNLTFDELRKDDRTTTLKKFLISYHDEMLIEKWNMQVGVDDTIIHLGDFAFNNIELFTSRLNGNKILLRGNHDLKNKQTYLKAGFKEVIDEIRVLINHNTFIKTPNIDKFWNGIFTDISLENNNFSILFSHYPIYNNNAWDVKKYGKITETLEEIFNDVNGNLNIHGHIHNNTSIYKNSINVSTEVCTNLAPQTLEYHINQYIKDRNGSPIECRD